MSLYSRLNFPGNAIVEDCNTQPPSNPQPAAPHWSISIDRPWRAVPLSSQCTRARLRLGRSPKRRKISAALAVSLPHTSAGRLPDTQDAHKRWSGLDVTRRSVRKRLDGRTNGHIQKWLLDHIKSSNTEKHDDYGNDPDPFQFCTKFNESLNADC